MRFCGRNNKKLGINWDSLGWWRWPNLVLTSASQCLPAEHHIPLNSESATCGVSRVLRTVCTVGKVEGGDRRWFGHFFLFNHLPLNLKLTQYRYMPRFLLDNISNPMREQLLSKQAWGLWIWPGTVKNLASLIVHRLINFLRVYLLNFITMSSYHMVARKIMLELSSKRLT